MSAPVRKGPPRAVRTSDVTRPRTVLLAAGGAAIGAAGIIAIGKTPLGAEQAMQRPHVIAKVECAKCHEAPVEAKTPEAVQAFASAGACKTCHGAAQHASVRPAHKALAARGELRCATCHPPHAGAQGITFAEDGTFVRWGAGAEAKPGTTLLHKKTTVPLVSLAACAKCHDPTSAKDPISACVSADVRNDPRALKQTTSLCFDEHKALVSADPSTKAGARFAVWDAAREISVTTPWVSKPKRDDTAWLPLGGAFAGATALGLVATVVERRKRKPAQAPARAPVPAEKKRLPVIDTSTCLGCYACVDACPFDVLTIEKYVAVVARPEECCGVVLCEQVCPNGSLRIDEGEPVRDRPRVDDHLESPDAPGIFIAGDLTGLPLIKNAINQGVRAIDRIASTIPRRRREPIDVIVVGAGPAGISAALRAKEKGLSCVVLEQGTIAASIKSFPRDKIVYDPPLDLPVEGELWLGEATKEQLLAQWTRIVRARSLDVREGRRVTAISKEGDGFVVTAENEAFHASRIVVAIGRRGTPRTLDLEIEHGAEDRISYALADARSFEGKRVVVVGLGDAAMEAAIALARQPGTTVTVSYRGGAFKRGKSRNVSEMQQLVAKGRIKLLFETIPVAVTRTSVTLAGTVAGKGRRTVNTDATLILIGGLPSWDLLTRAGVRKP